MTTAAVYGDGEDIVIPRELLDVLARVDRLARAKFGMLYGYRLMPQR
jgi:hypothetical protein